MALILIGQNRTATTIDIDEKKKNAGIVGRKMAHFVTVTDAMLIVDV